MKTPIFTLTAMGLGLMAGITVTHHYQVQAMVERGGANYVEPSQKQEIAIDSTKDVEQTAVKMVASDITAPPRPMAFAAARTDREDALLELLSEMRKEQKRIYKQMAEQNREIDELTFRVDSHSDSFKPLRTDSERPRTLDATTPQVPIDDDNLLPPKPPSGP